MEYRFKSLFDRSKEYTIETEEPLHLYDTFSISIRKIDNDNKSFSYDNIDCILQYSKRGSLDVNKLELDRFNYSGFYMTVEVYKRRSCFSMGEPIELVKEEKPYEFKDTTLENANNELKLAFNEYLESNGIIDILFQCFLHGVAYGKNKGTM